MFVNQWLWRFGQDRYTAFVRRYYEFREEDVVHICSKHHREIHELYDPIIVKHCKRFRKPIADFTWPEAEVLMATLVSRCNQWLKRQTKGSDVPWPSNGKTKTKAVDFLDVLEENDVLGAPEPTETPF